MRDGMMGVYSGKAAWRGVEWGEDMGNARVGKCVCDVVKSNIKYSERIIVHRCCIDQINVFEKLGRRDVG